MLKQQPLSGWDSRSKIFTQAQGLAVFSSDGQMPGNHYSEVQVIIVQDLSKESRNRSGMDKKRGDFRRLDVFTTE